MRIAERVTDLISDNLYLRVRFRQQFGWWPNVRNPRSFNEHLLRYKLSSKSDQRLPLLADKIAAKAAVAQQIGEHHVIPTIWSGPRLPPRGERNWPKPYVLKATHRSGANIFVHDGQVENWDAIEATCAEWLSAPFGVKGREWHYAKIAPRLLVEPCIGPPGTPPHDIKIFCFHGKAHVINIIQDRFGETKAYSFDTNWNLLPFDFIKKRGPEVPPPPANVQDLIRIAEALAHGFEYVSVDLYNVDDHIYFGEMTFTTANGTGQFHPPSGDFMLGQLWKQSAAGFSSSGNAPQFAYSVAEERYAAPGG
ncbi:ATP-grasp fold amidoligase family protein [Sphingobium sp. SCG-1]|uniref:ATP-grasp fold amidoligase family protein n=1 Tax=Sphingobium sp. SCG-1 TaxID=2072936 RepID=UPI0016715F2F|nr:ATP-grasp fold amidoligase family protein [Sphingobium sp. SCG-1]